MQRRLLMPLMLGFSVLAGLALLLRHEDFERRLDEEAAQRSARVQAAIEQQFQKNTAQLRDVLRALSAQEALSRAFAAKDRAALLAGARPVYEDLRGKHQVSGLTFLDLGGRALLRVQAPDQFGDAAESVALKAARITGKLADAILLCPDADLEQIVASPWEYDGHRIGYIEISMNIGITTPNLGQFPDMDLFAVVDKQRVDRKAWEARVKERNPAARWDQFPAVVLTDHTIAAPTTPIAEYLKRPPADNRRSMLDLPDGRRLAAQTVPVKDPEGNTLAHLGILSDTSADRDAYQRSQVILISVGMLTGLALLWFYFLSFRRIDKRMRSHQVALEHSNTDLAKEIIVRQGAEESLKFEQGQLEEKVLSRTTELADANGAMKLEIAAHERTRLDLERLFSSSLELLALSRMDGFILRANAAFCAAMGLQTSELESRFFADFVLPQDLPVVADALARAATGAIISDVVVRVVTRAGVTLETQWSLVPFPDGLRFYATGRDITQRTKLEESLRRTLHELREAQRIGGVGSWQVNLDTGVSTWSDETFRIFGYKPGEVTPDDKLTFDSIHPDDRERVRQIADRPRRPGEQHPIEYRLLRQGEVRDISANMEFVQGLDGRSPVLRGTCQDVTDRTRAETRRVRLEEQLRASQKMEAVGSLAGGIAHDFNNLLSVILSYVGFALDATPVTDPRHADLLEVRKAADRAAELTRQLLAFGRKQVLQPVSLNLNQVAAGMESMLRRIIGEDVTLAQKLDPQLGQTMADPGQIEQVLMNLVVNARDAMPRGGRLTIETGNVEVDTQPAIGLAAGPYVVLSVTDTGIGMDAATQAHMFEPFFTTKEVGKGTGLGLPTAYGIIRQSGGNITVYSEPGVGSTFRVYLPQAPSASETRPASPAASLMAGGNETILVVEDEPGVRQSTSRILGARGYKVLTAENGQDALRVSLEHEGVIDLVLTDVVMPRMGGVMLARQMSMRRPQARILFMSGYSGDAIARDGALDPGTQFIGKPFSATDLTRKVRQLLDSGRPDYPTDDTQAPPHPVSPKESP